MPKALSNEKTVFQWFSFCIHLTYPFITLVNIAKLINSVDKTVSQRIQLSYKKGYLYRFSTVKHGLSDKSSNLVFYLVPSLSYLSDAYILCVLLSFLLCHRLSDTSIFYLWTFGVLTFLGMHIGRLGCSWVT